MEFENRQPQEGINTVRENPLLVFFKLLVGAIITIVVLVVILQFSGSWIAKKVPFRYELALMEKVDIEFGSTDNSAELEAYLNDLGVKVAQALSLPETMSIQVHYDSSEVFNAYATIGGNLLFYKGLLEKMPNENTLAMVMAHEIAHVMHRDPIAGLGGGVASMVALMVLTGQSGTGAAGNVLNQTGMLTSTQFTRKMEEAADEAALAAMVNLYGHTNGANTLFELMENVAGDSAVPNWLERFAATHPLSADRAESVVLQSIENNWPTDGVLTALPENFSLWLRGNP